ncbi:MAG TPA: toxin-antitoxin system YwqK family antitoxin [Paraburkholderia sp.]
MSDTPAPASALAEAAAAHERTHEAHVVEERDDAGQLVSRVAVMNGVPHGDTVRYTPNGTPAFEARFEHGVLNGALRTYDEQGSLVQHAHYVGGKLHGVSALYRDGRLASRQHYALGVLHGASESYAASGLVVSQMTYEAGKLEREALFMHDGVVVRRASYRNGLLEGDVREYARDGALVQASPHRANLLHGTVRRFAPDGSVFEERAYRQGKPLGEWRRIEAGAPQDDAAAAGPRLVRQFEKWVRG